ncbi:hypothetical protein OXX79_002059 [Metschnikowia pulcherrima]
MSFEACSVCLEKDSKYTCPACESKTCSLECVKKHKLRTECTGQVDPTRFVPNKDLGANQALVNRDYNYLLNIERKVFLGKNDLKENAKQVFKRNFSQTKNVKRPRLNEPNNENPRLGLVRKIFPHVTNTSIKRENTLIIHLPAGMSRSSQNKSGYDKKSSAFTWTVEWSPLESGEMKKSFISYRLKESTPLCDAVPLSVLARSFGKENLEKQSLCFYLDNCVSTSAHQISLIPLSSSESLATALKDKIILEFPKIYVSSAPVLNADFSGYHGYGSGKAETSDESSTTSSESETSSDSESDTEDSDSGQKSDEPPEEESSKAPLLEGQKKEEAVADIIEIVHSDS